MASERGVVLVPFPETQAQEKGRGPPACFLLQSRGAWHTATSRSRSSLSCAESGTTRDAICIPPSPPRRLAGAGVSPAAEAYSWQ